MLTSAILLLVLFLFIVLEAFSDGFDHVFRDERTSTLGFGPFRTHLCRSDIAIFSLRQTELWLRIDWPGGCLRSESFARDPCSGGRAGPQVEKRSQWSEIVSLWLYPIWVQTVILGCVAALFPPKSPRVGLPTHCSDFVCLGF